MSTKMTPEAAARIQSARVQFQKEVSLQEYQVQLLKTLEKLNKK